MHTRTRLKVARQRILEHSAVLHAGLMLFLARGVINAGLRRTGLAVRDFAQVHRSARVELLRRIIEPYILRHRDVTYGPPNPPRAGDISRAFGKRMMVLKEPRADGEKGILYVMFGEMLALMFQRLDLERLMQEYRLVIEPSWSGYCDEDFIRYMQFKEDVLVAAAVPADYAFLKRSKSNLIPIPLGPADWVDPDIAAPYLDNEKQFDVVMNAHWGGWKRHHVLFRMLKHARRRYSVALIGGELEGTSKADVLALADAYGVRDQLTIYERIPYATVMDITCRARVSVLLSLKEGSNRAIAESIFCNVPVIVLSNHVGGIMKNVVPETGLLPDESTLEAAVEQLVGGSLSPRAWGMENISCHKSTLILNDILKRHALGKGEPWTGDIAERANSPESRYVHENDQARLQPFNEQLLRFVRADRADGASALT